MQSDWSSWAEAVSTASVMCESTGGYVSVAGESGATSCTLCGPGSYADEPNHVCADYQAQTYSTFGVDECLVCPSAVYKSKQLTGQSSCDPCPPGTLKTLTTCHKCDSGTIAELYQTECTLCDGVDEYSGVQGQPVPAEWAVSVNRDEITECPKGTYGVAGANSCTAYGAGEFSSETAATQCETTAADYVPSEDSFGGGAAIPCDGPGEYCDTEGQSEAKNTTAGYIPKFDRTGTEKCPPGTIASACVDECTPCSPGQFVRGTANAKCTDAAIGYYSLEKGKFEPMLCSNYVTGSTTLQAKTYSLDGCVCLGGEFKNGNTMKCKKVPAGNRDDVAGMTTQSMHLKKGHWRSSANSIAVAECFGNHDRCVECNNLVQDLTVDGGSLEFGGTAEVQTITSSADGSMTGGTFKLSFKGDVTGEILFDASAAAVKGFLEALDMIGFDEVVRERVNNGCFVWYVEFLGNIGDQPLMAVADKLELDGEGADLVVNEVVAGVAPPGTSEI
ncbi:hypothetical protein TrLO_g7955 [Triparma laevis f. longispina]|uniref:Tyrosine-protein kinase ephrin type A/B receptor-like domain-containing protein n=1 Tax=Triparma laevis f. longispina TaxID=1714387 RepID=A0A9W7FJT6_9STRA|nr:hypothetical protein TrLO_g7955 [Triparma laevis f. longispina]